REGGFEARRVSDQVVGRGGGGLVEERHGGLDVLRLAVAQLERAELHQRQRLVGLRSRLGDGVPKLGRGGLIALRLGGEARGILLGGLVGDLLVILLPGPDRERDRERGSRQGDNPRRGLADKRPVAVGAKLLL